MKFTREEFERIASEVAEFAYDEAWSEGRKMSPESFAAMHARILKCYLDREEALHALDPGHERLGE